MILRKFSILFLMFTVLIVLSIPKPGQAFLDQFIDPKDGALDASNWLIERKGFLPIPLFVSDPAVGYGLGAGLAFFHKSDEDIEKNSARKKERALNLYFNINRSIIP